MRMKEPESTGRSRMSMRSKQANKQTTGTNGRTSSGEEEHTTDTATEHHTSTRSRRLYQENKLSEVIFELFENAYSLQKCKLSLPCFISA